ncbi:MAG TPA: glutamate formimidoyltransferase [Thermoanaerobaculales bacterium]|nr:glutamate formimidoyltransferase [Thermoanaerobaculales bacterium]HQL30935.1 glutamate formimidoyltransferase [Thermoanaerobaculales bacterium]
MRIVECVPNISEGRRKDVYDAIAEAAAAVPGVRLLDVDPGQETNRTVITFVGDPEAVLEGAFQLVSASYELIDMRDHHGAHARMGATDVVPFVPVSGVSMEDCIELAHRLGRRIGGELRVPVYLYEHAATRPERSSLAAIRKGEYEALPKKLQDPEFAPDYGPAEFVPKFGATVIGARKFLVAYNVNLNATDKRWANRVAFDVREKGRTVVGADGRKVEQPGMLKAVRGVGWYIPEYGCAQVSLNLIDLDTTPLHAAFDACEDSARARGIRVTGSELVGLVPKRSMVDAGRHYLRRMERSPGAPISDLVQVAIRTLGLNDVAPFVAEEKIIEDILAPARPLASMTVQGFADETSRDSPAPGGGSVAALAGALAAALAAMVANLAHPKPAFAAVREELELLAVRGQELKQQLLDAIDEDTWAFQRLMEASASGDAEAGRSATLHAAEVPLAVAEACAEIAALCVRAIEIGMPASASDAGVGAAMARAAAVGAGMNVAINLQDMAGDAVAAELRRRAEEAVRRTAATADEAERRVWQRIGQGAGREVKDS